MNTDKNTVIGFILLAILLFVYFWYTNKQNLEWQTIRQKQEDSVRQVQARLRKVTDVAFASKDSLRRDSAAKISAAGSFTSAALGQESLEVLENEFLKVTLTSKGAQVKQVALKKYTTAKGKPVILGENNSLSYTINTSQNPADKLSRTNLPSKRMHIR